MRYEVAAISAGRNENSQDLDTILRVTGGIFFMSIVQIRASQGEQFLSAPATCRDTDAVLAEWYKDAWQSEMLVYPPNYIGDVTPQGWAHSSFILHVDQSGEQAQMMAGGKRQSEQEAVEMIEHLRAATPEQAKSIGSYATIGEHNRSVFVTTAIDQSTIAIGGIMLHVRPSRLRSLQGMFQTTEVGSSDS